MKKLKYLCVPLMLAVMASSCDKFEDFGDTNANPNATNTPITSALLTNVTAGVAGYASQTLGGLYSQYFSETQYTDASLYSLQQLNFAGNYSGPLYDLQNIIIQNSNDATKASASVNGSNANQIAIARILKAYIFWRLTDQWGDLPYFEALKGNGTPKFDRQEAIYKDLIKELREAAAQFDNGATVKGDVVFAGDNAKWRKTANSLRIMMALQLSKKYPGPADYSATEIKAALADPGGIITTNADNFAVKYPGGTFKSPWWGVYDGRKDLAESATLTTLLGGLSDGRQNAFGGKTEQPSGSSPDWNATSNVGVPYGLTRAKAEAFTLANQNWARVFRGDLRVEASTAYIITASQVWLARAEAADRGWTAENLTTAYQTGINRSFEQWGLAAPAASYFTQTNVVLGATGTGGNLKQIATQLYIASFPDGLSGWNIWRRTGFPVLTPAPDAVNASKTIPRRVTYGTNEYATNKTNLEASVALIPGGDKQESRVWWDQ